MTESGPGAHATIEGNNGSGEQWPLLSETMTGGVPSAIDGIGTRRQCVGAVQGQQGTGGLEVLWPSLEQVT